MKSYLQYGDIITIPDNVMQINGIVDVVPIKFDSLIEKWVICGQEIATHMLIVTEESLLFNNNDSEIKYKFVEIGKCKNIFLLADILS